MRAWIWLLILSIILAIIFVIAYIYYRGNAASGTSIYSSVPAWVWVVGVLSLLMFIITLGVFLYEYERNKSETSEINISKYNGKKSSAAVTKKNVTILTPPSRTQMMPPAPDTTYIPDTRQFPVTRQSTLTQPSPTYL